MLVLLLEYFKNLKYPTLLMTISVTTQHESTLLKSRQILAAKSKE